LIKDLYDREPDFDVPAFRDPEAVDPEVMAAFRNGETVGIFQFSTPVMTHLVKQIGPTNMLDLAACNALVRPGAAKIAHDYGRRKRDPSLIEYWAPELEPVLKDNYGLMIYQEDLMEIVQRLGGFTPGQADDMRKAMGKYYRLGKAEAQKFMQGYWDKWKEGTAERGIDTAKRDHIWSMILEFGGYGFNKSHAVLYAMTAYREMHLKIHDPDAFYAAELTYETKEDKRLDAVNEARDKNVAILPPVIGTSQAGFKLSRDGIHFGFEAVKGIGAKAASKLCNEIGWGDMDAVREDFPKNVVEALEEAGALDILGGRKGWDDDKKAELERKRLGMALSGAPVHERWGHIIQTRPGWISKTDYDEMEPGPKWSKNGNDGRITIGGEIISVDVLKVKSGRNKGRSYARFKIAYGSDIFRCLMFSDAYDELGELLNDRPPAVVIHGRKSEEGPDSELIVDKMASVTVVEKLEQERMVA
jgi:DNA polymerase-3 subunit alpha